MTAIPHFKPACSGLWFQASKQGITLSQAAKLRSHCTQHHRQQRNHSQAAAEQAVTADLSGQQEQLSLDLDASTAAEQSTMDEVAQVMAARLEQQARQMPPMSHQSAAQRLSKARSVAGELQTGKLKSLEQRRYLFKICPRWPL